MSLRYAVLGLLAAEPSSGYELTQRFHVSLANAWSASHSQIYPELGRLEEAGWVEVVGEGARNRKTYGITAAGRDELTRWLTETDPDRRQRNETALRGFLMFLLSPEQRRPLLERELEIARGQSAAFADIWRSKDDIEARQQTFVPLLDLGIRINAVMEQWLQEQLDAAQP